MMRKGYDSRCEELGRLFLGDEPDLLTDANASELAQEIQDVIEDYIAGKQPRCAHRLRSGECDQCVQEM